MKTLKKTLGWRDYMMREKEERRESMRGENKRWKMNLTCLFYWEWRCWFCFTTSHGARSGVMCRLCNDDLVIALVDMHNLSSFRCHRWSRDQSKEMSGRDVPSGMPEICTHKFHKFFGPVKISKTNRKIIRTKYLLELKIHCGYNLKNNILSKRIFSLWFFYLDHTLEDDDDIFLILKINWGPQVAYSRMTLLNGEECV